MAWVAAVLQVVSSGLDAAGTIREGKTAEKIGEFEATQLEQNRKAVEAEGTRVAREKRREGEFAESTARARGAASGGTTTDSGATTNIAKIRKRSDYNALASLYQYETIGQGLGAQADVARFEGKQRAKASRYRAMSTMLGGGSSAMGGMS